MLKTNVKDKLKTAAGAVTSVVQQRSKQVSIDLSKKTKPKGDNGNGFFSESNVRCSAIQRVFLGRTRSRENNACFAVPKSSND